jgi:hypothetical protein
MPSAPAVVFKRAVIATAACIALVGSCALYTRWQLYLLPECRGDIPKLVPFQEGMTLCPGQVAITITIQLPDSGGKDI